MQTLTSFTRSIRSATATTAEAKREALSWLVANGQADIGGQPFPVAPG